MTDVNVWQRSEAFAKSLASLPYVDAYKPVALYCPSKRLLDVPYIYSRDEWLIRLFAKDFACLHLSYGSLARLS